MARVLVTGAGGFVGARLQQRLASEGHCAIGTSTSDRDPATRYCDIEDRDTVESLLAEVDPEVIIHCAAISSVTAGQPLDYYRVNTVGTENLLDKFSTTKSRKRFILVSTAGVYGNQSFDVLHEELCPKPVHHYGLSKVCCERIVQNYASHFEYTVIRPFNIIGEGQNGEFIVPKLVDAFHRRLPTVRLGNIDVYRDYVDIEDAAAILIQLAFNPAAVGQTVNLCSGSPVSLKDLIRTLEVITGHKIEVEIAPEFVRRNEVWRLLGDTTKLAALMGRPLELKPIEQTLRRMLVSRD